jgi:hypothetical protein
LIDPFIDLDVELHEMREEFDERLQFSPNLETFSKCVNPAERRT